MPFNSTRTRTAMVIAVVLVFFTLACSLPHLGTSSHPEGHSPTIVPIITPGATPGSAAKYVTSMVTATGVNRQGTAVNSTSSFHIGTVVYVVLRIVGVTPGTTNLLTIGWYLNGSILHVTGADTDGLLSLALPPQSSSSFNADFSLRYAESGVGMAKVYWNKPASDAGTASNDPFLAQTITFVVNA